MGLLKVTLRLISVLGQKGATGLLPLFEISCVVWSQSSIRSGAFVMMCRAKELEYYKKLIVSDMKRWDLNIVNHLVWRSTISSTGLSFVIIKHKPKTILLLFMFIHQWSRFFFFLTSVLWPTPPQHKHHFQHHPICHYHITTSILITFISTITMKQWGCFYVVIEPTQLQLSYLQQTSKVSLNQTLY